MIKKILMSAFALVLIYLIISLDLVAFSDIQKIREFVLSYGIYAPLVFIILFTIVPLTLFPDALLAIAGGLIFGFVQGSIYIMIGAICGATLSFFISRYYGKWLKEKLQGEKFLKMDSKIKENGFLIIFLLRLIPLVPFDIISYSAGFSSIKYKDFILATFVGIIPGVLVYANIGAQSLHIGTNAFYISIGLLVLLMVISFFLKKRFAKNIKEETLYEE